MPLLQLSPRPVPLPLPPSDPLPFRKSWYTFLPLLLAVLLLLLPHPSYALILASHYLATHHAPVRFALHLIALHTLTLLALTSLMICAVRDPGGIRRGGAACIAAKTGVTARLLPDDASDDSDEHADAIHWCAHCRHVRPERAHHCSTCARCVLKMDHHCPWLGGNCIGHRTYPAFLHFLLMTTLFSGYIASVALVVTIDLVRYPSTVNPRVSPLHALFLLLTGAVFTLTMASFLAYHIYLASTNQTTLEHISPFLLLRYLRPHTPDNDPMHEGEAANPASPNTASATAHRAGPYCPPSEDSLSHAQRRIVQHAHGRIRPYDLGIWRNWGAVLGPGRCGADGERWRWWRWARWGGLLVLCGGHSRGDGWTYEQGEGVAGELEGLRKRLEDVGRNTHI